MSIAVIPVCVYVILSVCPHDKIKATETKITKLGTGIVHHNTSPIDEY